MTLTDLVDDFCLAQGNMRESTILAQYRHARWAWKDLFRQTLWVIRKQAICVDCKTESIILPNDCERVINISVVDCYGKLHPLGFNSDWNTAKIKCLQPTCACKNCEGEGTLCGAIDTISAVLSTVTINGKDYTKTVLTRYNGSGAVQTQTTIPVWDTEKEIVVDITTVETICNVETTEKGCIKATQSNMDALRTSCGCGNFINEWNQSGWGWNWYERNQRLIPAVYNYWGEWNYNAADGSIIQIFQSGRQHFGHTGQQEAQWRNNIRQVIVEYQTNGETPDTEILVPQYAVEAVQQGMFYRQKKLNTRVSAAERQMAYNEYMAEKIAVVKYLNPIIMDNIAKLQTIPRRW